MANVESELHAQATEIMQRGAEITLQTLDEVVIEIRDRHLQAPGMEEIAKDPVLTATSLRAIRATIAHWAAATVRDPWEHVTPADDPDSLRMARDLVRRGLSHSIATAYRVAQVDAWRTWISMVTSLTTSPELIRLVLDRTAESIGRFNEVTIQAVQEVVDKELSNLKSGSAAKRHEMIELLLDGAPIPTERASTSLNFDPELMHFASVVWTTAEDTDQSAMEGVVDLLIRASGGRRHVTTFPSTGVAWLWVSGSTLDIKGLESELRSWPTIRVAIGEAGTGSEGFRSSHRSALAVQRLISQSGLQQIARADDTRLAALLSRFGDEALDFTRSVLGDLVNAPAEVRLTAQIYLAELGSVTRTAERLFAHRNTIMRRLERADALLPQPMAARPLDTAAALELWQWMGNH